MINVSEIFGENVFNLDVMREKLPKDVFRSLKKTIDEGKPLDSSIAGAVAHAMKEGRSRRAPRTTRIGSSP